MITFGVTAFLLALGFRSWQLTSDDRVEDDVETPTVDIRPGATDREDRRADKEAIARRGVLERMKAHLDQGAPARSLELEPAEAVLLRDLIRGDSCGHVCSLDRDVDEYCWPRLAPRYDELFERMIESGRLQPGRVPETEQT